MTTLNNARRALLELDSLAVSSSNKFLADRLSVIGAYLDLLVPLNVENHTPGAPGMTAEAFHALYGARPLAVDNITVNGDMHVSGTLDEAVKSGTWGAGGGGKVFALSGEFTVPAPEVCMTNITLDGKRLTVEEANEVIRKFNDQSTHTGSGGGGATSGPSGAACLTRVVDGVIYTVGPGGGGAGGRNA